MVASFFLPLLFLASQLALVSARPSSPLSSLNNNKALRTIQRRQAKSADVVRRLRDGPRRRADPSNVPATCPAPSNYNLLSDGDFQLGTSLVCYSSSASTSSGQGFVTQGAYAYQEPTDGTNVNDHYSYMAFAEGGPSTITLSQTAALDGADYYDFRVLLGVVRTNTVACPITITFAGSHTLVIPDLCSDAAQCFQSGNGLWQTFSLYDNILGSETPTASVVISWDCGAVGTETSSFLYMADYLQVYDSA